MILGNSGMFKCGVYDFEVLGAVDLSKSVGEKPYQLIKNARIFLYMFTYLKSSISTKTNEITIQHFYKIIENHSKDFIFLI